MTSLGPIEAALTTDLRSEPYNFSLWDIHTGTQLVVFKGNKSNPIPKCLHVIDGNYFITAVDQVLNIWSIYNRKCQDQKLVLPGRPSTLCVSPCGNYLIVGISEAIRVWQIKSGNLLACNQRHYQTVSVLRMNHDGTFLISAGEDGMVLVWPFADVISQTHNTGALNLGTADGQTTGINEPRFTWQHHSGQVTDVHITNGGRCVTSSIDMTINIYSYIDGKRLFCIAFPSQIWSIAMNRNETSIYLGASDGNIYETAISSLSLSLNNSNKDEGCQKPIFTGHKGKIVSLLVSLDGTKLISASIDSSCKIWDVHQRKMLQDIKHQAPLANLSTLLVPESFSLTSMTQSQMKPPLYVKPLKRDLYKLPRDKAIMLSDLFDEGSTTIINIKNQPPSLKRCDSMDSGVKLLDPIGIKPSKPTTNGTDHATTSTENEVQRLRAKVRDLYMLSAEKIFQDAAKESLEQFKPDMDTNGTPKKMKTGAKTVAKAKSQR